MCHPSGDFRRTRGRGAGFTSPWMRNDSRAEENSAKKPIGCLAQLFRLCERAPRLAPERGERWRENSGVIARAGRRRDEVCETPRRTDRESCHRISFDQYFNERIIEINGARTVCRISRLYFQPESAFARFLFFLPRDDVRPVSRDDARGRKSIVYLEIYYTVWLYTKMTKDFRLIVLIKYHFAV